MKLPNKIFIKKENSIWVVIGLAKLDQFHLNYSRLEVIGRYSTYKSARLIRMHFMNKHVSYRPFSRDSNIWTPPKS